MEWHLRNKIATFRRIIIPTMTPNLSHRALTAVGVGAGVALLYALTAARTVVFIDSGELATVSWTLGIAHPTGYPLFTLVSWIAAHFPAGPSPIVRLNLLSALFSAAGVTAFFLLSCRIFGGRAGRGMKAAGPAGKAASARTGDPVLPAALFGALTLAFSVTYWSQSASVEVYPLHAFLLIALIWLFLEAFPETDAARRREAPHAPAGGRAHLFAYVLGLSFANHMSTIYLAPAFLVLYFRRRGGGRGAWTALFRLAPAFLLGLSVYLFLPVRAASGPLMNWGDPSGVEAFLRHLSGKQYSVWIFSSAETAGRQLAYFFGTLGAEFSYAPPVLALWGLAFLYRRHRDLFLLIFLLFAGCLAFAVNYDINDIASYFLLAYIATAFAAAAGLFAILTALRGRARAALLVVSAIFLAWQGARTHPDADQSGLRLVDQYARSILTASDTGGIVISYQWDYFVSASYYLQVVEGVRPDVMVVDKELIRRTWYIGYLRRRYPRLLEGLDAEVESYLRELRKFERGEPYDPRTIELRYAGLIGGIISRHYPSAAVYVTPEIEGQYTSGYARVPHGLALRLRREGDPPLWREVPVTIDPPSRDDPYSAGITMLAARAELSSALYLERLGMVPEAARAAARAAAIRPDLTEVRAALQRLTP